MQRRRRGGGGRGGEEESEGEAEAEAPVTDLQEGRLPVRAGEELRPAFA